MDNFQQKLLEYADLLITVGANVQKGQTLWLKCSAQCHEFSSMLAESAYRAGAGEVVVDYLNAHIDKLRFRHAQDSVFNSVAPYLVEKHRHMAAIKAATLLVDAFDPDAGQGIDPARMQRQRVATNGDPTIYEYKRRQTSGGWQWSMAAWPTPAWAAKVFPGLAPAAALERLWAAVFSAVRVTGDGTAPEKWREKSRRGLQRIAALNAFAFESLEYTSGLGTSLTVRLPRGHYWSGHVERTDAGVDFVPNLPTEEVFTAPDRSSANGVLVASRPLNTPGGIIEDFRFTLKDGKIIDAQAGRGQEILTSLLDTDEGARFLGEAALVSADSPVSAQNLLFFNTLYDENAACHFAFGRCYPTVAGAQKLTPQQQLALGLNQSITHVDFMIGTPDLSITGIQADGTRVAVFRDGNYAF